MKTINLCANLTEKKLSEINAGGGKVTKTENGWVFFDVPKTYPNLSPQALKKFDAGGDRF